MTSLPAMPVRRAPPPSPRAAPGRAAPGRAARRRAAGWPPRSRPAPRPRAPRGTTAATSSGESDAPPAPDGRSQAGRSRGTRRCRSRGRRRSATPGARASPPTSRIDLTPAQTTMIGVRASVARSADSSKRHVRLAVHPAEAAGGEHADARTRGQVRGRGDRGRAVPAARQRPARGRARCTLTTPPPATTCAAPLVEPDPDLARHQGDRRRNGPLHPHGGLQLPRHLQVARPRQPVRDQRALQRDGGPAALQRLGDLRSEPQRIVRAITTRWISLVPS